MISDEDLRVVYDVAVGSLDFGSGFLDSEEVSALRRLAEHFGLDPMDATPSEHRDNYRHGYEECSVRAWTGEIKKQCGVCGRHEGWWAHRDEGDS